MRIDVVVVTGVSRGLGEALFRQLLELGYTIVAISRQFTPLQSAAATANPRVHLLKADLSSVDDDFRSALGAALIVAGASRIIFINNAATLGPLERIGSLPPDAMQRAVAVNLAAPAIIAGWLAAYCADGDRELFVLNVTTGAALRPIEGLAAYCTTKAAARMFFDVLAAENPSTRVEHHDPGVVDTRMQGDLRDAPIGSLSSEDRSTFRALWEEGKLKTPDEAALQIIERWFQ
ncbi:MAG: SDR family NAD(P)-dependent oxidoreductase [Gemmatimonadota bacterium]